MYDDKNHVKIPKKSKDMSYLAAHGLCLSSMITKKLLKGNKYICDPEFLKMRKQYFSEGLVSEYYNKLSREIKTIGVDTVFNIQELSTHAASPLKIEEDYHPMKTNREHVNKPHVDHFNDNGPHTNFFNCASAGVKNKVGSVTRVAVLNSMRKAVTDYVHRSMENQKLCQSIDTFLSNIRQNDESSYRTCFDKEKYCGIVNNLNKGETASIPSNGDKSVYLSLPTSKFRQLFQKENDRLSKDEQIEMICSIFCNHGCDRMGQVLDDWIENGVPSKTNTYEPYVCEFTCCDYERLLSF